MTPDTSLYLVLGLVAVSVIFLLFVGSMIARYNSYQQDLKMIEQLKEE